MWESIPGQRMFPLAPQDLVNCVFEPVYLEGVQLFLLLSLSLCVSPVSCPGLTCFTCVSLSLPHSNRCYMVVGPTCCVFVDLSSPCFVTVIKTFPSRRNQLHFSKTSFCLRNDLDNNDDATLCARICLSVCSVWGWMFVKIVCLYLTTIMAACASGSSGLCKRILSLGDKTEGIVPALWKSVCFIVGNKNSKPPKRPFEAERAVSPVKLAGHRETIITSRGSSELGKPYRSILIRSLSMSELLSVPREVKDRSHTPTHTMEACREQNRSELRRADKQEDSWIKEHCRKSNILLRSACQWSYLERSCSANGLSDVNTSQCWRLKRFCCLLGNLRVAIVFDRLYVEVVLLETFLLVEYWI